MTMEDNLTTNPSVEQTSKQPLTDHQISQQIVHNKKQNNDEDDDIFIDNESILLEGEMDPPEFHSSESLFVGPSMRKQYDPTIDDRLPDTVTLLRTPDGGKVYLVGTAHFSEESQNDVSMIIQAVQPHSVMVELCEARVHILELDEETILKKTESLDMEVIRHTIRKNGVFNGVLYILLLNMSAHLTRQLGIAPGGEFRRAFTEAKKVPNCSIHLGDRPINITLQRALSSLSWWKTITLAWTLIRSRESISKEDVERIKCSDSLENLLAEMTRDYPCLGEVFVKERDLYLTYSLQLAALPRPTSAGLIPSRIVGIVGIGHTPGMKQHWGKVRSSDIEPIMKIPPKSLSSKILKITFRLSLIGGVIYIGYKYFPMPSAETFESIKSSIEGLIKASIYR